MNITVIIACIVFITLMLILVLLLLAAKSAVAPSSQEQARVTVDINNGARRLKVSPGETLAATLAQEQILLPSSCGGKANCGQCLVRVLQGGGDVLPTESASLSPRQLADKWRLACQVKVHEDIKMEIPESVLSARMITCEVLSNRNVSAMYKELRLRIPEGEDFTYSSGEFIQLYVPEGRVYFSDFEIDNRFKWDWKEQNLYSLQSNCVEETSRAYTILSYPGEKIEDAGGSTVIKLLVRLALPPEGCAQPGACSSYIFSLKPGDKVRIAGPYGEALLPEDMPHEQELVFISGGAGMSLSRSHICSLLKAGKSTRRIIFYYGARTFADAFYVNEFRALEREFPNFRFRLVLDIPDMEAIMNGVDFDQGYVHQAVYENYLKDHRSARSNLYFVCGPPEMVNATRSMLAALDVPHENILGDDFS